MQGALADTRALVIGGSSESGPVLCEVLAENGADVALTYYRKKDEAEKTASLCQAWGARTLYAYLDLENVSQACSVVDLVVEEFGGLDLLVNLGGPPPIFTHLRDVTEREFDFMMNTHFKGYFFLARCAAWHMSRAVGGLIVNVSATSSMKYDHASYGLAKSCVTSMTRFLAHSFAPTVRVLTLTPGLIDLAEIDEHVRSERAKSSPLERLVTPKELGEAVVALCSGAFASMTGEELVLDGGYWLRHP